MTFWSSLKSLARNLGRRQSVEKDLDAEIRAYRDLLEDEKLHSGANSQDVRRETLLELGGAEQIKERVRDIRRGAALDALGTELRQSFRGLRRNPALTILGTAMLAIGMAASVVVFSIFQSALLKPLPFREPGHLVTIWETRAARGVDQ